MKRLGFSLIELMVAVAIVGIIASIAYPAYTNHTRSVRRNEGQIALQSAAIRMEEYATNNGSYPSVTGAAGLSSAGTRNYSGDTQVASAYSLDYQPTNSGANFIVIATPSTINGTAWTDTACPTLAINDTGQKGIYSGGVVTTKAECWQ